MPLPDIFQHMRPSIVAFGSKMAKGQKGGPPLFPPLIGTGFVVHTNGVLATNRHVAEALLKLPVHPKTKAPSGFALVFDEIKEEVGGYGLTAHFVDILQIQMVSSFGFAGEFYAEKIPDLAFVQVVVKNLKPVSLATEKWAIRVGMEIATAGFPLGTDPLIAHGVVGQGTPFLRRGIVSAVNPFPCPHPHGFTIDVMSQGGASGSPIFRTDDGEVVGILYAAFPGTNITFAVPSSILNDALKVFMLEHANAVEDLTTIEELEEWRAKNPEKPDQPWTAV